MIQLESYVQDKWVKGSGPAATLVNPATEEALGECSTGGIDFGQVVRHGREVGGRALRAMTFPERAAMLKSLAKALHEHREELIEVSIRNAGTTRSDAKLDIDGATGTLSAYAYYGQELGDRPFLVDGEGVQLGRTPRFWGRHVLVPRPGVAVHINAFNFPAWNMFEKAACAWLAGVPVIEKPGTSTAMLAYVMGKKAVESGVLPPGAFQLLCGRTGDLLDHLGPQDTLAFTGSAATGFKLRSNPTLLRQGVRTNIEADSLNAAVLAPDADATTDAFKLFVRNVIFDMRQKTGQKCTAVRRILVPQALMADAKDGLLEQIAAIKTGDPSDKAVNMGPVASRSQFDDVRAGIGELAKSASIAAGGADAAFDKGFFVQPTLLVADTADAEIFHDLEVFGPAQTLMPYDGAAASAAEIVERGQGCLVSSIYSNDTDWIREAVLGLAPWIGRIWIGDDKVAEHANPPGLVVPGSIHGGPGRAGAGEELGGLRGLHPYLQRTALQGFKGIVERKFGE